MIINNKSIVQEIVPGILIKTKVGYFGNFGNEHHPEERFYILTEIIKTTDRYEHEHDTLVFYGLIEERFLHLYRWHIERYIEDGVANIVA